MVTFCTAFRDTFPSGLQCTNNFSLSPSATLAVMALTLAQDTRTRCSCTALASLTLTLSTPIVLIEILVRLIIGGIAAVFGLCSGRAKAFSATVLNHIGTQCLLLLGGITVIGFPIYMTYRLANTPFPSTRSG